jgi:hypothetical protein
MATITALARDFYSKATAGELYRRSFEATHLP